jgi:hypothetical protein
VSEQLLVSQEGHGSMKLVVFFKTSFITVCLCSNANINSNLIKTKWTNVID